MRFRAVITSLFAIFILTFHLIATAAYLMPSSPLKESLPKILTAYIDQFFYQNWHLFSPDPAIQTDYLWFRCRSADRKWTEWYDSIKPILKQSRESYFGPASKLLQMQIDLPREMVSAIEAIHRAKCGEKPSLTCEVEENRVRAEFQKSSIYPVIVRYVTEQCYKTPEFSNQSERLSSMSFMLVTKWPFPYSKKELAKTQEYYDIKKIEFNEVRLVSKKNES